MFESPSKDLSSMIRGYKGTVAKFANHNSLPFQWQRGFNDVIIRTKSDYFKYTNYIRNNIVKSDLTDDDDLLDLIL